jgi:hypothetical protein
VGRVYINKIIKYLKQIFEKEKPLIVYNAIETPDGTLLVSEHIHDFKTYKDRNGLTYMVDGGKAYQRRNVHENAPYIERSLYSNDSFELIRQYFT